VLKIEKGEGLFFFSKISSLGFKVICVVCDKML